MQMMSDPEKSQTLISKPLTYSVRMAVKTPSKVVQYRMLEADVTVTGEDVDVLRGEAETALATSLAQLCLMMGETPPEEIRPTLEEAVGAEVLEGIYAEG